VIAVAIKIYRGWSDHQIPKSDGSIVRLPEGQFAEKFTKVKTSGAGLEHLKKCRLITGRNSDGDSFHVKHEKGENQFRLYFVDAPESEYKEYGGGENNSERLNEQAE
jgi:endonuclease YncB( thermonuclease family)